MTDFHFTTEELKQFTALDLYQLFEDKRKELRQAFEKQWLNAAPGDPDNLLLFDKQALARYDLEVTLQRLFEDWKAAQDE